MSEKLHWRVLRDLDTFRLMLRSKVTYEQGWEEQPQFCVALGRCEYLDTKGPDGEGRAVDVAEIYQNGSFLVHRLDAASGQEIPLYRHRLSSDDLRVISDAYLLWAAGRTPVLAGPYLT